MASELTETRVGALGEVVTITGTPLKMGVYTATKSAQNDFVLLADFTDVKEVLACYTVSAGARTAEGFTIDVTTTNKVTFTSGTTGVTVSVVAVGI